jgi:hypothetical protein
LAITTSDVSLVRIVHEIVQCDLPTDASAVAAQSGSLASLQYVHEKNAKYFHQDVVKAAI